MGVRGSQATDRRMRVRRVGYLLSDPGVDLTRGEGGPVHARKVVEGLRAAGLEVDFLALQERAARVLSTADPTVLGASRPPIDPPPGLIEWIDDGSVGARALESSLQLAGWARRTFSSCDLLHERLAPFQVGGVVAARCLGIPHVLEVNAPPVEEALAYYPSLFVDRPLPFARATAAWCLAETAAIVTVSEPLRDLLVEDWAVDRAKVTVVPNGADPVPPVDSDRRASLRDQLGVPPVPVLLFVGALQPWHGLDVLLSAFAEIRGRRPDCLLVLVGDGPERERLEGLARSLALAGTAVRFEGAIAPRRVASWVGLADVALAPYPRLTTDFYFSPLKLFEYMAARKPIVASRIGQVADVLTHEDSAWLVEPGSSAEIVEAVDHLLANPRLARALGAAAHAVFEDGFTWTHHVDRLRDVYERVAGGVGADPVATGT